MMAGVEVRDGGGGGIVPSVRTFSIPSSVSVFVCGKYTQLDSLSLSSLCIIFFKKQQQRISGK